MKSTFDLNKNIIYSTILFFIIVDSQSQSSYKCKSSVESMFEEEINEHLLNSLHNSATAVIFLYQFDNDTIEVFDSENNLLHEMKPLKTSNVLDTANRGYP